MMKSFKAVLFDLDGTLLDTLKDLALSMNRVLEKNGFPTHPEKKYRYFVGEGASMLVRRAVPDGIRSDKKALARLHQEFLEDYAQNWDKNTRLYPGIDQMLDELSRKGLKLAILSNKPHDFTKLCVERFLDSWHFDMVLGDRPGVPRKPDPAGALEVADFFNIPRDSFLYLGDTSIDMTTATRAGMFPVGVLWGFRDRQELEDSGARAIISVPLQLLEIFE